MGTNVSLTTFSPNTTIQSSAVNTNFSNINNAPSFSGSLIGTANNASGLKTSGGVTAATLDSSGNVTFPNNVIINGTLTTTGGGGGASAQSLVNSNGQTGATVSSSGNLNVNNSINVGNGNVNLRVNSISRISQFFATNSGNYSHGLGAIPDGVLITTSVSGTTMSYNYVATTMTSSVVTIGTQVGGFQVNVMCFKLSG